MPVFFILVFLAILVFLIILIPFYGKIGSAFLKLFGKLEDEEEEEDNKETKETKDKEKEKD